MSQLKPDQLLQILYGSAQEVTENRGRQGDTKITRYRDDEGNWRVRKDYGFFLEEMLERELKILGQIPAKLGGPELRHLASATLPLLTRKYIDLAWYGLDLEDWLRLFSARDAKNLVEWRNAGLLLQLLRAALLGLRGLHMLQIVHGNIRADKLCLTGHFHKATKTLELAPSSLVLVGLGLAVAQDRDIGRLLKLDFCNDFDGRPAYWKSRALWEAHAKLAAGRMQGVHFSCAMDYASLGLVIERHLRELARLTGLEDWRSLPAGDPAQVACLVQIVREMTDEDKPVSEPLHGPALARWLEAIDAALGAAPHESAWLLRLAVNHEAQLLPPSYEDRRPSFFAIPPRFDKAWGFAANGLAMIYIKDKDKESLRPLGTDLGGCVGYINTKGEIVIPPRFSDAREFAANGLAIVKDGYAGCIDAQGKEVVPLRFNYIGEFAANGLAMIEVKDKYGYVNTRGEEIVPPRFDGASGFADNGLARIKVKDQYGYVNEKGEEVIPPRFSWADDFVNGLARFRVDGKYGYINEKGEEITPPRFDAARQFAANGLASVAVNDKQGYIDTKGKEVIPLRFNEAGDFVHGLAAVRALSGLSGYIDEKGEEIIEPRFSRAQDFAADGLAIIEIRNEGDGPAFLAGYINRTGEVVIEPRFLAATSFAANGLAVVQVDDWLSYGYTNKKGEVVIEPRFGWASDFNEHNVAKVGLASGGFYINEKGEALTPSFGNMIVSASTHYGLRPVCVRGQWGYIRIPGPA